MRTLTLENDPLAVAVEFSADAFRVVLDDGRELPLFKLETSSESHAFYTGTQKSVDNLGGRVEKFRNRFGKVAR